MKIIFLDIDGVLNSYEGWVRIDNGDESNLRYLNEDKYAKGSWVDNLLVDRLRELISNTEATIVGVSSWFTSRHDVEEVSDFLGIKITETTDYTGGGLQRGMSVDRYVNEHKVKDYVVLDDSLQMYNEEQQKNLIHVNGRTGLTDEDVQKAISILNKRDTK